MKKFFISLQVIRKAIARCLTLINERMRNAYRAKYAGAKRVPYDLRGKKTRAIRRRLTRA